MKDAFGRELQVGDQVVYASRYGSHVDLRVLIVLAITHKKCGYSGTNISAVRCVPYEGGGKELLYGVSSLLVKLQPLTPPPANVDPPPHSPVAPVPHNGVMGGDFGGGFA